MKYFECNLDGNVSIDLVCGAFKATLQGKLVVMQAYRGRLWCNMEIELESEVKKTLTLMESDTSRVFIDVTE